MNARWQYLPLRRVMIKLNLLFVLLINVSLPVAAKASYFPDLLDQDYEIRADTTNRMIAASEHSWQLTPEGLGGICRRGLPSMPGCKETLSTANRALLTIKRAGGILAEKLSYFPGGIAVLMRSARRPGPRVSLLGRLQVPKESTENQIIDLISNLTKSDDFGKVVNAYDGLKEWGVYPTVYHSEVRYIGNEPDGAAFYYNPDYSLTAVCDSTHEDKSIVTPLECAGLLKRFKRALAEDPAFISWIRRSGIFNVVLSSYRNSMECKYKGLDMSLNDMAAGRDTVGDPGTFYVSSASSKDLRQKLKNLYSYYQRTLTDPKYGCALRPHVHFVPKSKNEVPSVLTHGPYFYQ